MDMDAPSSLSSWLARFHKGWKRIFFWQSTPTHSREAAPHANSDQRLVAHVTTPTPLPRWQQFRYLSHVFPRKERVQFWTSLGAGICFLLIGLGFFAEPHLLRQPAQGGRITEGVVGSPKWVNPVLAPLRDVDSDLSRLLFSGLFTYDRLTLRPDLAARTQLLDQGRTLEIKLREDARFHDGQPLTADDVTFTINDAIKNPTWHSSLANAFKDITAIRIDEYTVQIKIGDASISLPELQNLLTVGILPAHLWAEANDGSPQLAEGNLKPIGSGPYQFESFSRDTHGTILTFTLKRFPGYYGAAPYLDQREFRFYPDRKSAEVALQSNQIDALAFVPWSEAANLRITDAKALSLELPQVTTVFFNSQDQILKDPSVRHALQLAIDRSELIQQIPHASPVQTPFPFFDTYSTSSQLTNLDEARRLLESRDWKLNSASGRRFLQPTTSATNTSPSPSSASSTPLTISILVPAQGDVLVVADYLKRRWSLLGVDVVVEPNDRTEIIRRAISERTHQVTIFNVPAANDLDLLSFWEKGENNLNFSQWTSPAVSAGFQTLANATNTQTITQARTKITDTILSDHVASFLLRPSYAYFVPNALQGTGNVQIRNLSDRLIETHNWYLQTRYRWQPSL